jgi:glycerol kinase
MNLKKGRSRMDRYLLAIDQGTTSSRAIIFSHLGKPISQHQIDLAQSYPHDGWVEQNPEEMWQNTLECCRKALQKSQLSIHEIIAAGITNQRETTFVWDKNTGKTIYPAIVWQDRRTHAYCDSFLKNEFYQALQYKTGLLLDPYFSLTKIVWILDNVPFAREHAEKGDLLFGTVDTFLLWKLTKGKVHATDATNASRTLLFNIHTQQWDAEILNFFNIPHLLLPKVLDSAADFGQIDAEFLGKPLQIASMIGDQQAATVGQACFSYGMVKCTYGTGGFLFLNTGKEIIRSKNSLLSTIAYRLNNEVTYGLEGSIFCIGSTVKWLRDKLKIISTAAETESLAKAVDSTDGVYLVPAFSGLGAPYWNPQARAAILGLTQNSSIHHIVRAALEAVGYQTKDLLTAMEMDSQLSISTLRVDGGMTANQWLLQFLADILDLSIQTPFCLETTALGAAFLAGLQAGVYQDLGEISNIWQEKYIFTSKMLESERNKLYLGWKQAIARVLL